MTLRAYSDNVVIRLEPLATMTASGLHLPGTQKTKQTGSREATVMAVGPGHRDARGVLVPLDPWLQPGRRVIVDALAGQNYDLDLTTPRHNKPTHWADDSGEFRIVRADEILAGLEDSEAAE